MAIKQHFWRNAADQPILLYPSLLRQSPIDITGDFVIIANYQLYLFRERRHVAIIYGFLQWLFSLDDVVNTLPGKTVSCGRISKDGCGRTYWAIWLASVFHWGYMYIDPGVHVVKESDRMSVQTGNVWLDQRCLRITGSHATMPRGNTFCLMFPIWHHYMAFAGGVSLYPMRNTSRKNTKHPTDDGLTHSVGGSTLDVRIWRR